MIFSSTKTNIDLELSIHDLKVNYGKRNILKGVSLLFSPGLHFIAGLNGSGKSSLMKAICGSISFSGTILLNGKALQELSAKERARHIAVVEQNSSPAFPVTVFEFTLMGRFPWLGWLGNYSAKDFKITNESLEIFGLAALASQNIHQISGGELQKVFLARAICQQAEVLLLDEPEASLDVKNKNQLLELLKKLATEGKIIICNSHDPSFLQTAGSTVKGLRDGGIAFEGMGENAWTELNRLVFQ